MPTPSLPRVATQLLTLALGLAPAHAQPFEEVSAALGLMTVADPSFSNQLTVGVSAADLDGDGHLDVLAIVADQFIHYRGGPTGLSRVDTGGLITRGERIEGHALFDLDGDGDLDLWLGRHGQSRLLLNAGGTFTDVTAERLPALRDEDTVAVPVDLDGDGHVDLLVSRYVDRSAFPSHRCATNLFLHNDGHGRLHDRTEAIGLAGHRGCTLLSVVHDVDGDGLLDLIVINDFAQTVDPQELWIQVGRGPDGLPRFEERAADLGFVARAYGMGLAVGDPDLDGRLDYVITNIGAPVSLTFDPDLGRFVETPPAWRPPLRHADVMAMSTWVGRFEDLDGDGAEDLLLGGSRLGAADFLANRDPPESPMLLAGEGGWAEVPLGSAVAPARDLAFGDLDGDGIPEIITLLYSGVVGIWRNLGRGSPPTTFTLAPHHTATAWGAVLTMRCGDVSRRRHLLGGLEYGQTQEARVSVDLPGPCAAPGQPAEVDLRWPSGLSETYRVETGRAHRLHESPGWSFDLESLTLRVFAETALQGEVIVHAGGLIVASDSVEEGGDRLLSFSREPIAESILTRHPDGAWIGVAVGRALPSAIVRLPSLDPAGVPAPVLWLDAPSLVPGAVVRGSLTWPEGSLPEPLPPLVWRGLGTGEAVQVPAEPTTSGLRFSLTWPSDPVVDLLLDDGAGTAWRLHTEGRWSPTRSELVPQHHVFLDPLASAEELVLRLRARDGNGRRVDLTTAAVRVTRDGSALTLASITPGFDDWLVLRLRRENLRDGDRLGVTIDGLPFGEPVTVARLRRSEDFARVIDGGRSLCVLSEPWLDADDGDVGTIIASVKDRDGHVILGRPQPTWEGGVGWELRPRPPSRNVFYDAMEVRAHSDATGPGAVRFGEAAIPCEVPLGDSPARFAPAPALTEMQRVDTGQGPVAPGVTQTLEIIPRSLSGRAVGSGLDLVVRPASGLEIEGPVRHVGGGRYRVGVLLQHLEAGPVVVDLRGPQGAMQQLGAWYPEDLSSEPPEPGPEPTPEGGEDMAPSGGDEGGDGSDVSGAEAQAEVEPPQEGRGGCGGGGTGEVPAALALLWVSRQARRFRSRTRPAG